jgi:DNA polymerase/3'-5' exonuclease PolX
MIVKNQHLINTFKTLILQYQQELKDTKDKSINFKISTFRKAIKIIEALDFEIINGNQLKDYKGIGTKTMDKIDEIIKEGDLKRLKGFEANNSISKENELKRITGIGPAKAKKLIEQKIYLPTLKLLMKKGKLKQLSTMLTHHQLVGLKYLDDIEQKIPYSEIQTIEIYLMSFIKTIDKNLNMIICGSYRRKKSTSGDIDILMYHSKTNQPGFLKQFIDILKENKFLVDDLTTEGSTKYMGVCRFKSGIAHRIDIRYIQKEYLASSMLYFTGSGDFNKNMRTYAIKHKFKLNEYGLYKLKADGETGLKLKTDTEEAIFKHLKLPYIPPENRTELIKF